jgi:hypothetical protein
MGQGGGNLTAIPQDELRPWRVNLAIPSAIVDVGLALPILDAGGMGQQVTDATLHRSGVGVQREPVRQTAPGSSFWKYYSRTASRRSASR